MLEFVEHWCFKLAVAQCALSFFYYQSAYCVGQHNVLAVGGITCPVMFGTLLPRFVEHFVLLCDCKVCINTIS